MNDIQHVNVKVNNIVETSMEALEHILGLLKEEKYDSCARLYDDIIQGFLTIQQSSLPITPKVESLLTTIQQGLVRVVELYEGKEQTLLYDETKSTLIPGYTKLFIFLKNEHPDDSLPKKVIIGIYDPDMNPRTAMPTERVMALIDEADKQSGMAIFFTNSNVNFETKTVNAECLQGNKFIQKTFPLPDVIQNFNYTLGSKQTPMEKKLRELVPFTRYIVGNKYALPTKLLNSAFEEFIIPFEVVDHYSVVEDFLNQNNSAVIKPINSNQGFDVLYIEKKEDKYHVTEHLTVNTLNEQLFKEFVKKIISNKNKSWIIQPFIKCRTIDGAPFDIRAHVQKDGEAKWVMTKMYTRIGVQKSILSNISKGGSSKDIDVFLVKEFNESAPEIERMLYTLSMELATYIDSQFNFSIDELGIDLAIDETGRFWIFEVNNGPQSKYHEAERAKNTIAYSIYIAKNQIFLTNKYEMI